MRKIFKLVSSVALACSTCLAVVMPASVAYAQDDDDDDSTGGSAWWLYALVFGGSIPSGGHGIISRFAIADIDGSGRLDSAELDAAVSRTVAGPRGHTAASDDMMRRIDMGAEIARLDANGDGQLSLLELTPTPRKSATAW